MRRISQVLLVTGCAGLGIAVTGSSVHAQESLGGLGAASGISTTLSGIGAGAAGGMAMNQARNMGQGGSGPGFEDGSAASGYGGPPGAPGMPGMPAQGAAAPQRQSLPFNRSSITGGGIIRELMRSAPRPSRTPPARRRRLTPQQSAQAATRLARTPPRQRMQSVYNKYRKPPVGWLSYYLPQDRAKVTSSIWRFVTIEDDQGRYPVRYYYTPSSPQMLRLLSTSPRGIRRADRVIGFHSWQDAMLAGYRPDPVSQPAPANQIVNIARLTRGPELERYAEFVYSGQITPRVFDLNYRYIQATAKTVRSKKYTQPLVGRTIARVLGAALGENPLPQYVGGTPRPAVAATPAGQVPGMPGQPPSMAPPRAELMERR